MKSVAFILVCGLMVMSFSVVAVAQENQIYYGLIEPSEIVNVSSQINGTLEEILVERGDMVEKDQIIALLNSNIEKSAVALALARVEFGKRKVDRNEELFRKQLISIHDKDEMETELRISELQFREAQEKLAIRTIRSPTSGFVMERFLSPGEYVGEEPILQIARIDPLYVEVVVPVEEIGTIMKGMAAKVRPEHPGTERYDASVIIVDRVIDAASGTFGVRLELANPDRLLPAGLKCTVRFLEK